MLVSHHHAFVYMKTVKTGGTSVEAYFERFTTRDPAWTFAPLRSEREDAEGIVGFRGGSVPDDCRFWNHMPAALIRERLGVERWDRYCKFCVVRNPFERAVSGFYFFERQRADELLRADPDTLRRRFELWTCQQLDRLRDDGQYLIDGRLCVDVVLRHERLGEDMQALCRRLDLPWNAAWLPELKRGIRPPQASAAALYTPTARARVADYFAADLARFDYRFPDD